MIPKIIHYCWFGKNPLPKSVQKCISSWKKYCPDYEIIEWNEDNFDINSNQYIKEAYQRKKYAFVSDYVRLYALYNIGGIYMDTDVEVLKRLDDYPDDTAVFGFEEANFIATSFMASSPKNNIIKEFFELYNKESFLREDGTINTSTNVERLTNLLIAKGLKRNNKYQILNGCVVFPQEYYSPYDYINCVDNRTENTYCIHWFDVSWMSKKEHLKKFIKKSLTLILGKNSLKKLRKDAKC